MLPVSSSERSWLTTASLIALAMVAIGAALIYTRPLLVPFVLALLLAFLVAPLVDFLHLRWRAPRWLAVVVALLSVAGFLTLVALLITTSVRSVLDNVDIYRERVIAIATQMLGVLDRFNINLGQREFSEQLADWMRNLPVGQWLRGAAGTAFDLISNGFLVMVFLIYLVAGRNPREQVVGIYAEINAKVRRFIVVKFLTSATTGVLVGVILALVGLDLALVFGLIAFFLNFIPNVGSVVATLVPVPMALVQFESALPVVAVLVLPSLVQMTIGNFIEPMVMGEGLDLHPVTILLALIFWGLTWGVVGMLLATPISAVLKIVLSRMQMTEPLAELMAGRLPRDFPEFTTTQG